MERIIPSIMKVETAAPYGYCPTCASPGKSRERRPGGNDVCMSGHTYPSNASVQRSQASSEPVKETSRVENTREGICPSCNEQMRLSTANGIPVHVCMQHSVVMPLRDPETIHVQ